MVNSNSHVSIGQLAALAGVTTRTIRHYERIGLMPTAARTGSGYRLYSNADKARLADILIMREMGMSLDEIGCALRRPSSRAEVLRSHLEGLRRQESNVRRLIVSVEQQIELLQKGEIVSDEVLFNGFEHNPHEAEAQERWGHTDAYRESTRRAKSYTPEDWKLFEAQMGSLNDRLISAMHADVDPEAEEVMDLAEEHRQLISTWFYPCTYEIHRGLAEMYIADPRFTENIDKAAIGLADYMRRAMVANADRGDLQG